MKQFTYTITDPVGIHARPAGLLSSALAALASSPAGRAWIPTGSVMVYSNFFMGKHPFNKIYFRIPRQAAGGHGLTRF